MTQTAVQTSVPVVSSPARKVVQFWAVALIGSLLFAAIGHLLIKFGLIQAAHVAVSHPNTPRLIVYLTNPIVLGGLLIYGLGTIMWVFAVSRKEISFLYPLTALNYGLVAVGGHVLFSENISTGRWVGIAIVILGVLLMQRSTARSSE